MSISIRPIVPSDLENCSRLLIKAYNQPPWRHNWNFEQALKYLNEYADVKQFVGFVLVDEGEIMGALFAYRKTWWTNDQLMISELYISPDAQGAGYGKKLLEAAEQYSKDNGIKSLSLMTSTVFASFSFYIKQGFIHAEQFGFLFKIV